MSTLRSVVPVGAGDDEADVAVFVGEAAERGDERGQVLAPLQRAQGEDERRPVDVGQAGRSVVGRDRRDRWGAEMDRADPIGGEQLADLDASWRSTT